MQRGQCTCFVLNCKRATEQSYQLSDLLKEKSIRSAYVQARIGGMGGEFRARMCGSGELVLASAAAFHIAPAAGSRTLRALSRASPCAASRKPMLVFCSVSMMATPWFSSRRRTVSKIGSTGRGARPLQAASGSIMRGCTRYDHRPLSRNPPRSGKFLVGFVICDWCKQRKTGNRFLLRDGAVPCLM